MPGVVGLITNLPRERALEELLTMLGTLRYEPYYITGTWEDRSLGVYVGWVARKDSFSDGMPLSSESGNAVLVFSGEDHPEPGTVAKLKERGHTLSADGPSYLVHLYEEDPSFPAVLNGWFHGLLVDRPRKTAMLFNDRYGLHRLYYHESKEAFYFAAEAKAILAVRPELRRADTKGLGESVSLGCVLENRTLFQGIAVLPAASAWSFRNGSIEHKASYFQPQEWEEQEPLEPEAYYRELREVFSAKPTPVFQWTAAYRDVIDRGIGHAGDHGLAQAFPGSLPCYTFGGTYRECRDVLVAREVARACGQPHQVIRSGQEFLSSFPDYAERTVYLTDGCADVGCSPVLYGCQMAREIAPVRMTGNYGDQVLRGMRAFKPSVPAPGLFASDLLPHLAEARKTYSKITDTHPLSFAAFRQAPWHHYGLLALEQTQLTMRSPFLDNDVVRATFRAPQSVAKNNDLRIRLIGDGNLALRHIRTDMGFAGRANNFPAPCFAVTTISRLRPNTPITTGCRSGRPRSIILWRRSISSAFSSAGTSITIFGSGTGTGSPNTFRKCSLTRALFPGLTSKEMRLNPWYKVTSKEIGTIPTKSTGYSRWSCCIAFSSTLNVRTRAIKNVWR